MITGIHHASISVSDMNQSIVFYRDLLGLKLLYVTEGGGEETSRGVGVKGANMKLAVLKAGEDQIELIQYVSPKGKPYDRLPCDIGNMHIAFLVKDIDKTYSDLKQKGLKFNASPIEITEEPMKGWKWTYFKDPDGAQLELVEQSKGQSN